jgi:hypothetical protein
MGLIKQYPNITLIQLVNKLNFISRITLKWDQLPQVKVYWNIRLNPVYFHTCPDGKSVEHKKPPKYYFGGFTLQSKITTRVQPNL